MTPTILTLLGAGLLLMALEVIMPGMVVGIMGAIALVTGVVLAFVQGGANPGLFALLIAGAGCGLLGFWYSRYFQQSRIGRKMVLNTPVSGGESRPELTALVGVKGESATDLRPSGVILIGGHRIDAQSDGEWIEQGAAVTVMRVQGASVVVRKVS